MKTSVRYPPFRPAPSASSQSEVNIKKWPSWETFPRGVDQNPFFAVLKVCANRQTACCSSPTATQRISLSQARSTRSGSLSPPGLSFRYVDRQTGAVSEGSTLFQERCLSNGQTTGWGMSGINGENEPTLPRDLMARFIESRRPRGLIK